MSPVRLVLVAAWVTGAAAVAPGQAVTPGQVALTPVQVREDVGIAAAALREIHPELYRYKTEEQVDAALKAAVTNVRDSSDLFLSLLRAVSSIQDHHTWVEPRDAGAEQAEAMRAYLPFAVRFIDGRLHVVRPDQVAVGALPPADGPPNPEAALGLQPGDEIVAIDGVKAAAMLRRLLPLVASDGDTDGYRVAALNGSPNYPAGSAFYAYWPYAYPEMVRDGTARLRVRSRDGGRERAVTVPLVDRATWFRRVGSPLGRPVSVEKTWGFRFEGDVAILRAGTFLVRGAEADGQLRMLLGHTLGELNRRKPRRLVIDLRGNGGGQDIGIDLLRGFARQPFTFQQASIFNRLSLSPALKRHVRTYEGPVPDLPEAGFSRRADGRWRADPAGTPRSHAPQTPLPGAFAGDVTILVDGGVASAATMFAAKAQSLGRARIIGEPTGGSRLGPSAGLVLFATLPNSGVRLTIPVIRSVMDAPRPGPDGGVVPDRIVRTTLDDVVAGRDPVLAAALAE